MSDFTDTDTETFWAVDQHIAAARDLVKGYQDRHPDHADARVSEMTNRLNRAAVLARHMRDGIHPEGDAARRGLLERLGYGPEGVE